MSSTEISTRERILQETRRLMEERRGQGVRIEDIARAARVSRQAVYMHFGTRAGLLTATARYLDETLGLSERTNPIWSQEDGLAVFTSYIEFWANYIPEVYGLAKALMNARDTDEDAAAAWKDRMDAVHRGCTNAVKALDKDGLLAPPWTPEDAGDFMWSTHSIATWENLTLERGWSQEKYVQWMTHFLKRALVKTTG
jgi:AcrR family transcriptional regulator